MRIPRDYWLCGGRIVSLRCGGLARRGDSAQPAAQSGETVSFLGVWRRFSARVRWHGPSRRLCSGAMYGDGNRAELLVNGDAMLPSLLADIREAQKTIHISIFLW